LIGFSPMNSRNPESATQQIIKQARNLGADIAGAASWRQVAAGPSYAIQPLLPRWGGVGVGQPRGEPVKRAASLIVVGMAHPGGKPELDWWRSDLPSRTLGNVELARITKALAGWLGEEWGVAAWDLAYHVERGGVFLKDAAVSAGLGVVGLNNLFLCPEFGSRVRLRALAVDMALAPAPASAWDPCRDCPRPCRQACPQNALQGHALAPGLEGPENLPARDGAYERGLCNQQMEADIEAGKTFKGPGKEKPFKQVRYCRRCELVCPAGRQAKSGSAID